MVKVLNSFVRGPLEPYVVGLADELLRQGYTRASAAQYVTFIAHMDRWMSAEGLGLDGLTGQVIDRYLCERRARVRGQYRSRRALRPLLDYLAPMGVLPGVERVQLGPVDDLLGRYRAYLVGERGLAADTARGYVDCVRPFAASRLRGMIVDLDGITAGAGLRLT